MVFYPILDLQLWILEGLMKTSPILGEALGMVYDGWEALGLPHRTNLPTQWQYLNKPLYIG